MKNINHKPIIGLEIHVELNTKTKMFCRCPAKYFGEEPNTYTCPVCLGLPGALPYPNKTANEYCVMIALALQCKITDFSYFERKNYFYPDLPKGYQISQYINPFGIDGYLNIKSSAQDSKRIRIRRVHMEEDTAKLIHPSGNQDEHSYIDFNRSGVPLVEIVTEPDIASAEEAKIFLTKLQRIIRYLGVSDADMEKGNMRLEPNISLRELTTENIKLDTEKLPNYKVEVKNINSFRFVEKAINYEIERQMKILEKGEIPVQETRGWDDIKNKTVSQRIKEEAHDYRYFPEPDIPPIKIDKTYVEKIKEKIPELPDEKIQRFAKEYLLSFYDSEILAREKQTADYFEEGVIIGLKESITPKQIANRMINDKTFNPETTLPAQLIEEMLLLKKDILEVITDEDKKKIETVIKENPQAAEAYGNGKMQVIGFLIGAVNKKLQGKKINPQLIKNTLEMLLKK
ncbi:MAG: hypothetical protein A2857_07140 [Candidatus Levybacteria bacterium RIFCSPHIGHO2_01_FULL_36_15]|nr:MAG: hypothetical protein A2857_07140 [Candidatus Levybacteria bacterium RIFCSPHIGHO2_01_FULL_36_15]OGH38384.1 MAG: hypothetical protein A2905_00355 [Candidatus Levybacteria bacterium RIFCSPLOWO2_01_FULL_36_10]